MGTTAGVLSEGSNSGTPANSSFHMITKEVNIIKRKRRYDGTELSRKERKGLRYCMSVTQVCEVTTWRFLGIAFFRKTQVIKVS